MDYGQRPEWRTEDGAPYKVGKNGTRQQGRGGLHRPLPTRIPPGYKPGQSPAAGHSTKRRRGVIYKRFYASPPSEGVPPQTRG